MSQVFTDADYLRQIAKHYEGHFYPPEYTAHAKRLHKIADTLTSAPKEQAEPINASITGTGNAVPADLHVTHGAYQLYIAAKEQAEPVADFIASQKPLAPEFAEAIDKHRRYLYAAQPERRGGDAESICGRLQSIAADLHGREPDTIDGIFEVIDALRAAATAEESK